LNLDLHTKHKVGSERTDGIWRGKVGEGFPEKERIQIKKAVASYKEGFRKQACAHR
jgi:hypothetical protein